MDSNINNLATGPDIPLDGGKATLITGERQYAPIQEGPPSDAFDRTFSGYVKIGELPPEGEEPQPVECSILLGSDDGSSLTFAGKTLSIPDEPGPEGGNSYQEKTDSVSLMPGWYKVSLTYHNIAYKNPDNNVAILNASINGGLQLYDVVPDKKKPEKKPCEKDDNQGGSSSSNTRSSRQGTLRTSLSNESSSSAGSHVIANSDGDGMLWRCNFGSFRGMSGIPGGFLEIIPDQFSHQLWTPSLLSFRHPVNSRLAPPQHGWGANRFFQIINGADISNYFIDGEGEYAGNVGTTAQQEEQVMLLDVAMQPTRGIPDYVQISYPNRTSIIYDAQSGNPVKLTGSDRAEYNLEEFSDFLDIVKSDDAATIRQVWNLWDGLADITDITEDGYVISLYLPSQVGNKDMITGIYSVTGIPFKQFAISGNATTNKLTIREIVPHRPDHVTTWWAENGSWSMTKGSEEEAVHTKRVKTVLSQTQWELITTISQGSEDRVISCIKELYLVTNQGDRCISRVEGYGSDIARTTTYEYDSSGRKITEIRPDGGIYRWVYDETERLIVKHEPWVGGDNRITYTFYKEKKSSNKDIDYERVVLIKDAKPIQLSRTDYTYSEVGNARRIEKRTTSLGSNAIKLSISEIWLSSAPSTHARGRVKMKQNTNGIQSHFSYEETSEYDALYKIVEEQRVNGELISNQSSRDVRYVSMEGNTTRMEKYVLINSDWILVDSEDYLYNDSNQWIRKTCGNGRVTEREMLCCGPLWERNEDGVLTSYSYDSLRRVTEVIRSSTETTPETITSYLYDAVGHKIQTRTDCGSLTTINLVEYDILGQITKEIDPLGNVTTYAYSKDGLTVTKTLPSGATIITRRHADGTIIHQSGSGQRELKYTIQAGTSGIAVTTAETGMDGKSDIILSKKILNGFGETIQTEEPNTLGGMIINQFSYNDLGQRVKTQTANMAPVLEEYDSMGNLKKRIIALSDSPSIHNSRIEEYETQYILRENVIYARTKTTKYTETGIPIVSMEDKLVSKLDGLIESKSITTDVRSNEFISWSEYTAPTKRTQKVSYQGSQYPATKVLIDDYLVKETDFAGYIVNQYQRTYTESGIITRTTDVRGNVTETVTNLMGWTIQEKNPQGSVSSTEYDSSGNPVLLVDNDGKTTINKYDLRGRKISTCGTASYPVCVAYDQANRIASLTTYRAKEEIISSDPSVRPDGDQVTWENDPATGLVLKKIFPSGACIIYEYDELNRPKAMCQSRGVATSYTYAPLTGELISIVHENTGEKQPSSVVYTYNFLGQKTSVSDASGIRLFSYDDYNEQKEESFSNIPVNIRQKKDLFGRSAGYSLNYQGKLVQEVTYNYDNKSRIGSISLNKLDSPFSYEYDDVSGYLKSIAYPNQMKKIYSTIPELPAINKLSYDKPASDYPGAMVEYEYDSRLNIASKKDYFNSATPDLRHQYSYNDRNELVKDSMSGGRMYEYSYDNIGNRNSSREENLSRDYTTNALNQYSEISSSPTDRFIPVFDADGNQTKIKTATGEWEVSYNHLNRPVLFSNGVSRIECKYDDMGRRSEKALYENNILKYRKIFVYNGYKQIAEFDATLSENSPSLRKTYLWEISQDETSRILAMTSFDNQGTYVEDIYYSHDALNNIIALFGIARGRRALYEYSPYGAIIKSEGNAAMDNPFRYSCEYTDDELALIYYNYRYYNPLDGRWISRDPNEESNKITSYLFVNNRPSSSIDVLGKKAFEFVSPPNLGFICDLWVIDISFNLSYKIKINAEPNIPQEECETKLPSLNGAKLSPKVDVFQFGLSVSLDIEGDGASIHLEAKAGIELDWWDIHTVGEFSVTVTGEHQLWKDTSSVGGEIMECVCFKSKLSVTPTLTVHVYQARLALVVVAVVSLAALCFFVPAAAPAALGSAKGALVAIPAYISANLLPLAGAPALLALAAVVKETLPDAVSLVPTLS